MARCRGQRHHEILQEAGLPCPSPHKPCSSPGLPGRQRDAGAASTQPPGTVPEGRPGTPGSLSPGKGSVRVSRNAGALPSHFRATMAARPVPEPTRGPASGPQGIGTRQYWGDQDPRTSTIGRYWVGSLRCLSWPRNIQPLLWLEGCPPHSAAEALPPVSRNVTLLGNGDFGKDEVIRATDGCPYKRGKCGRTDRHAQGEPGPQGRVGGTEPPGAGRAANPSRGPRDGTGPTGGSASRRGAHRLLLLRVQYWRGLSQQADAPAETVLRSAYAHHTLRTTRLQSQRKHPEYVNNSSSF